MSKQHIIIRIIYTLDVDYYKIHNIFLLFVHCVNSCVFTLWITVFFYSSASPSRHRTKKRNEKCSIWFTTKRSIERENVMLKLIHLHWFFSSSSFSCYCCCLREGKNVNRRRKKKMKTGEDNTFRLSLLHFFVLLVFA